MAHTNPSPGAAVVTVVLLTVALLGHGGASAGSSCSLDRYEVVGNVVEAGGSAARRARVFVLLDKVSQKKFQQHGIRVQRTATNGLGQFQISIDCEAHRNSPGQPNPCARKVRDVTIGIGSRGGRLTLREFKLKDLNVSERRGACVVEIPPIRLAP